MTWCVARRLDYIAWRLTVHGEVQRDDIVRNFGVSMSQASADLSAFEREHPEVMRYDKTLKRYVPAKAKFRSLRGFGDPNVLRAISLLAAAGHPMGWRD